MNVSRPTFWSIPHEQQVIMYLLVAAATVIAIARLVKLFQLYLECSPEVSARSFRERLRNICLYAVAQKKVLRKLYVGTAHLCISSGIIVLFIGTLLVFLDHDFRLKILVGKTYLVVEMLLDLFGLCVLAGLVMALVRRIARFRKESTLEDYGVLVLLVLVAASGFAVEAARLAVTQPEFARWSPVGNAAASLFKVVGATSVASYRYVWWFHVILAFFAIAALPYSKLLHTLLAFISTAAGPWKPGELLQPPFDIVRRSEEEVAASLSGFGVGEPRDLTRGQLVGVLSCTGCRRCEEVCPAYLAGRPFSPRLLVDKLRSKDFWTGAGSESMFSTEEILSCTTCGACMNRCPVMLRHVQIVVDLRRNAMYEGRVEPAVARVCRNLANCGNPWGFPWNTRIEWSDKLQRKALNGKQAEEIDVLYWVGCMSAFDTRQHETAEAIVKLLEAAGVNFAVLGNDERCCGEFARREGEEGLFQVVARRNIATFEKLGIRNVVTSCPHCFYAFKYEYPRFGGTFFSVMHHTHLVQRLIESGRLPLKGRLERLLTYHDPCYLGRYAGSYDEVRNILSVINLGEIREMERSREDSLCCGGGGGYIWTVPQLPGGKINELRLEEALKTGADTIVTACPYCLAMLEEASQSKETKVSIADVAVLTAQLV